MAEPKSILIVEDDRFLSLVLKNKLEKEGFLVEQAFDGKEGIDMLNRKKFDLVVLDLIMPKMSGFEFLEILRSDPRFKDVNVVVATNLGQESDIEKVKNLGVNNYFVKAKVPIDDLVGILKSILKPS